MNGKVVTLLIITGRVQTLEASSTSPERGTIDLVTSLFDTNSYFVTGDTAYCTDALGTAKISYGLALGVLHRIQKGGLTLFWVEKNVTRVT